ncbi:MAG: arylsulfatase [Alphaproteobacteria bacterium]|nr:arylsulfatase [Alphaproteobacteria bacterium]
MLTFLHTAESNVAAVGKLMAELAPEIPIRHHLSAELLAEAVKAGTVTDAVAAGVRAKLADAASGASVVVCTCSTIGAVAEAANGTLPVPVQRIDRAMAEVAVSKGRRILVAACVASTVGPTSDLIAKVAREAGRPADLRVVLIAEAWPKFLAGDVKGYEAMIVERLEREKGDAEVVVLAQASMAGTAPEAERRLGLPVLTSPRLGVTAAIAAWRKAQG